jgi:RNA polymerase sigma-70 factor (ECF subfamily)
MFDTAPVSEIFLERLAFGMPLRLKQFMTQDKSHKQEEALFDPQALLVDVGTRKDRDAFIRLFGYYAPRVKSYLLKHGADESAADEVVQNTFVTVWEKAGSYNPAKAAPSTWIFTIARNKRIDSLRKERFIDINTDDPAFGNVAAEAAEEYADDAAVGHLNDAIDTLPAEQARLLRMAFFEDKSHSVIAKETKLPLGTVKSRLRMAMEKLRLLLVKDK